MVKTSAAINTKVRLGQSQLELNDTIIKKVYESIMQDMPIKKQGRDQGKKESKNKMKSKPSQDSSIDFKLHGLNIILKDKKEFLLLKIFGLKVNRRVTRTKISSLVRLRDFQVIQNECEIFLRHHSSSLPMRGPQHLGEHDFLQEDPLDLNLSESHFETNLIDFSEIQEGHTKTSNVVISDFLLIMDLTRVLNILNIVKSFESQVTQTVKAYKKHHLPNKPAE